MSKQNRSDRRSSTSPQSQTQKSTDQNVDSVRHYKPREEVDPTSIGPLEGFLGTNGLSAPFLAPFEKLLQAPLASAIDNELKTRRPKKRRRRRNERGLPTDQTLRELSETYLKEQHKLFPDLVASGQLPPLSELTFANMINEFKERFFSAAL